MAKPDLCVLTSAKAHGRIKAAVGRIEGVEDWQRARLIPVAGIRGQVEQAARATSAYLAVLSAVPSFARAVLAGLGAPRGQVET